MDLLTELYSTRLKRLPDAQFVYWSGSQHPRLVNNAGQEMWLYPNKHLYQLDLNYHPYERMCELEQELFGTGEQKVFYKSQLWTCTEPQKVWEQNLVYMFCEVACAYMYDGDVHTTPKIEKPEAKAFLPHAKQWIHLKGPK